MLASALHGTRAELESLTCGFVKTGDLYYVPMGVICVEKTLDVTSISLRRFGHVMCCILAEIISVRSGKVSHVIWGSVPFLHGVDIS